MTNAVNLASAAGTGFFRNKLINGNFDIWQRGTSGFGLQNIYSADRWMSGTAATGSVYRSAFTVGQTAVPDNPTYYLSFNKTNTADYAVITHKVEDVQTLSGQTVTLSFWAKADANTTVSAYAYQNFGSGGSATVSTPFTVQDGAVTTSWKKFVATISLPSISGKTIGSSSFLGIQILPGAGSSSWVGTFDLAQVQLEAGSVATSFERRSYGAELALCQRYYQKYSDGTLYGSWGSGSGYSMCSGMFPVVMRAAPSFSITGNSYSYYGGGVSTNSYQFQFSGVGSAAAPGFSLTLTAEL